MLPPHGDWITEAGRDQKGERKLGIVFFELPVSLVQNKDDHQDWSGQPCVYDSYTPAYSSWQRKNSMNTLLNGTIRTSLEKPSLGFNPRSYSTLSDYCITIFYSV